MNHAVQQLLQAVHACNDPLTPVEHRKAAVQVLQQASAADPSISCSAAVTLIQPDQPIEARLSGLNLLQQVVRKRWNKLNSGQQGDVAQRVIGACQDKSFFGGSSYPLKSKLASVVSDVALRMGAEFAVNTLNLMRDIVYSDDPNAAHLGYLVLQYISEEVNEVGLGAAQGEKRTMLACIIAQSPTLLQCVFEGSSHYVQKGINAAAAQQTSEAAACRNTVLAALGVLTTLAAWLPLSVLCQSQLIEACTFLVQADEFKAKVIEACLEMSNRSKKQATDDPANYQKLYPQICKLLNFAVPRLCPANSSEQAMEDTDQADLACRVCECCQAFAVNGHLLVVPAEDVQQALQHLLMFLQHKYLPLVATALPAWAQLIQDCERDATGTGSSSGGVSDPVVAIPDGFVHAAMQACVGHLTAVVSPSDSEDDVPIYMDAVTEWKDFCSALKSRLKYILAEASRLAPTAGLSISSELVAAALPVVRAVVPGASQAVIDAGFSKLEVLAFALDALVPGICLTKHAASCVAGLESLLASILQLQPHSANCIAQLGKTMESFAAVVELDPRLVNPAVDSFFKLLQCMHELRGSVPARNDDTALYIKEQRQLSKCFVALASKAPTAFVPVLETVVQRTMHFVSEGIIGDADKNQILEGILASSASNGVELFGKVVNWLVAPCKEYWAGLVSQFTSESVFVDSFLTPISGAGPDLRVGKLEERTRLYYTLQLLMICARQCKRVQGPGGGQALDEHLEWMLVPALRLQRCLNGLAKQEVLQGPLAPIACVLDLSPLEKAVCIGHQAFMDAKARADQVEPGRMDGSSLHGVRGWIRQSKELVMMLLMECASKCPALWTSQQLCREVPENIFYCLELQELRSLRLIIHHGLIPFLHSCPVAVAVDWMQGLLAKMIPLLSERVSVTWRDIIAKTTGVSGNEQAKQTEDEIIQEVLLRELSRDTVELLRALVGSTSFPTIPPDRMAAIASRNMHALGAARRALLQQRTQGEAKFEAGSTGNGPKTTADKGPALNSVGWNETVASAILPVAPNVIAGALQLATQAMSWPDHHTQGRAVAVCRTVAAAAGFPLNPVMNKAVDRPPAPAAPLQPLLVQHLVPGLLFSMSQPSTSHVHSEMLLLLRSVYISGAGMNPSPADVIRSTLPQATEASIQALNAELGQNKSEKLQKDVLKRFFTTCGFTSFEANTDNNVSGVGTTGTIRDPAVAQQTAGAVLRPSSPKWQIPDMFDPQVASYLNS